MGLLLVVLLLAVAWWASRPQLFLMGQDGFIDMLPARAGDEVGISFMHSVQKTKVEEYLTLSDDLSELVLQRTVYHSFGVGLPFMESDGHFRQEGNSFIMEDMDRHFPSLSLRTGLGTQLTLTAGGKEYPFYQMFGLGYRIDIFTAPRIYYLKTLLL